ncbi:ATP-grasp domain-containing protein [soil metagenome]
MKHVLVSGASGIVGYGVLRSLRQSQKDLQLIGTTMYGDSVAPAFCDVFEKAPPTDDAGYLDWFFDVIRKHRVDLVIPGIEIDMYKWVEHVTEIEARGAKVLLNRVDLVALCKDKWLFYQQLKESAPPLAIPTSVSSDFGTLVEEFGLPFLLKPKRGFGSKGIVKVGSEKSFSDHRQDIGTILIAQQIVGADDEEYTTSAFCDGTGGALASMTLRRRLSKDGFTDRAEVAELPGIAPALAALCARFKPVGPTNFQFRLHAGELKLLEINPRISSATSIRAAFGYNESAMAVDYYLEKKNPSQPLIRRGRAVRYTEDFIFYEDGLHI